MTAPETKILPGTYGEVMGKIQPSPPIPGRSPQSSEEQPPACSRLRLSSGVTNHPDAAADFSVEATETTRSSDPGFTPLRAEERGGCKFPLDPQHTKPINHTRQKEPAKAPKWSKRCLGG